MPPVLLVLNLCALLFAFLLLYILDSAYRRVFLIAMVLPMILWIIIAVISFPQASWGFTEVIMMLLRGSFILGVFSGGLACYIVTKLKQK